MPGDQDAQIRTLVTTMMRKVTGYKSYTINGTSVVLVMEVGSQSTYDRAQIEVLGNLLRRNHDVGLSVSPSSDGTLGLPPT